MDEEEIDFYKHGSRPTRERFALNKFFCGFVALETVLGQMYCIYPDDKDIFPVYVRNGDIPVTGTRRSRTFENSLFGRFVQDFCYVNGCFTT